MKHGADPYIMNCKKNNAYSINNSGFSVRSQKIQDLLDEHDID